MKKIIHLNAFNQCAAALQSFGQFRNPRDRTSQEYTSTRFWVDLARTLEAGCFDSIFFADVHGAYDVYKGSAEAGIRHAVQFPGNDPTMLFPAMAQATRHLGFISTYSTTYYPPFHTAKLFSSLDHFTGGRVGWNIVTSYLDSACRNGLGEMLPHDQRYERAEEYMEVAYKLWEASWEEDAVVRDSARDMHTDPARVHPIHHKGKYFEVEGPHMCEPSPQRTPLLAAGRPIEPRHRVRRAPRRGAVPGLSDDRGHAGARGAHPRRHPRAGTRPRPRQAGPGALGDRRGDRTRRRVSRSSACARTPAPRARSRCSADGPASTLRNSATTTCSTAFLRRASSRPRDGSRRCIRNARRSRWPRRARR